MSDFTLPEFFVICGSAILTTFLIFEIFEWTKNFGSFESKKSMSTFGTPSAWKCLYSEHRYGEEESSVNIKTSLAVVVQSSEPLKWNGYSSKPVIVTMANDGNTVTVSGFWTPDLRPNITGGPLSEVYDFHSMIFHWGPTDKDGSEHSLDDVTYPLELQMIHMKHNFHSPFDAIVLGEKHGVAIVSILFQISEADNKFLDHVVNNLCRIPSPGSKVCVAPFALSGFFPLFEKHYYSYSGSMAQESSNELVTWIVQPEPVNVSPSQMKKFRSVQLTEVPAVLDGKLFERQNERDLYYQD
ncbi:carbonic anhydrase 1-like [Venturia canescens]|uniref:carbonic anhydrase 1-like n=1 Tax=Venturia canescens TaxID=32260 RepID=UPI001C9BF92A|nr:carbonic anhydrase 1-like [Venturia canescens]